MGTSTNALYLSQIRRARCRQQQLLPLCDLIEQSHGRAGEQSGKQFVGTGSSSEKV